MYLGSVFLLPAEDGIFDEIDGLSLNFAEFHAFPHTGIPYVRYFMVLPSSTPYYC